MPVGLVIAATSTTATAAPIKTVDTIWMVAVAVNSCSWIGNCTLSELFTVKMI